MSNTDKGKYGERKVAKRLTTIFGLPFIRTANSGASVGKSNSLRLAKISENQATSLRGDIIPPDEFSLVVEVKKYKTFPFHQLLKPTSSALLDGWISEVEFDSSFQQLPWMLVFSIDRQGLFSCVDFRQYEKNGICKPNNFVMYGVYLIAEFDSFVLGNVDSLRKTWSKK